jgi:MFS family permease
VSVGVKSQERVGLRSLISDRTSRNIAAASLVNSTGTGLFMTSSLIFYTRFIGLSATSVAAGLAIASIMGMATTMPTGILADHLGIYRVYAVLQCVLASGFILYTLAHGWPLFLVAACVVGIGTGSSGSLLQAIVTRSVNARTKVILMSATRMLNNVGYAVGGAFATIALAVNTRSAFDILILANALSFLVTAAMILRSRSIDGQGISAGNYSGGTRKKIGVVRDWKFGSLAILNGSLLIYSTMETIGLPLWIERKTQAPTWCIGPLFVLNTVGCVVLQLPLSKAARTLTGAGRTYLMSALSISAAVAVAGTAAAPSQPWAAVVLLVLAMSLLTVGEVFQSAAQYGSSFALSPEGREGTYLSTFGLGTAAQRMYGPFVAAGIVAAGAVGWYLLSGVILVVGLACRQLITMSSPAIRSE